MLLLKQDTIRKKQVNKNITKLDADNNDNKKYKVKAIYNSIVYIKKLKSSHLLDLYYLLF